MDRRKDRSDVDMDRSEIGPYLGSPRTKSGGPKKTPHPRTSEVRRFLRKRHVRRHGPPQSRTARRSVPTSEAFGRYPESYHKLNLTRAPPQVGLHPRVSTTNSASPEHLRGKAISPKAPRPQTRTAAEPDRSEIGPYLGGLRSISRVVPQTQPHPGTSPGRATSKGFYHKLSLA